jgi:alginate O-acetyltransferase complex protein AlgI
LLRAPRSASVLSSFLVRLVKVVFVFHLVAFAWIPFRAESMVDVGIAIRRIAFDRGPLFSSGLINISCVVALLVVSDLISHYFKFWDQLPRVSLAWRWQVAMVLIFSIVLLGIESHSQFIYFQF